MKHVSKVFLGLLIGVGLSCAMEQPRHPDQPVSLALDYSFEKNEEPIEFQSTEPTPSSIDPLAQYRELIEKAREHTARLRLGKGNLPCPKGCLRKFKSERTLRQHMRDAHENDPDLYICEICQASFTVKRYLRGHKTRMHYQ